MARWRSQADVHVAAPGSLTTLSGRQTQFQNSALSSVVTSTNSHHDETSEPQLSVEQLAFGPTLDILPTINEDGHTVKLAIVASVTEFLGYDDPGAFVPNAIGDPTPKKPLTATLPLPHFRVHEARVDTVLGDGQSVVVGAPIFESAPKVGSKVPVLADVPFVGRLFRSESGTTATNRLLILVTPTLIDGAGNPIHSGAEIRSR